MPEGPRKRRTSKGCIIITDRNMEITKHQFKSFDGINELIIEHGPHIRSIDVAQYILDLQNEVIMLKDIVQDLKQREKKIEKVVDLTG